MKLLLLLYIFLYVVITALGVNAQFNAQCGDCSQIKPLCPDHGLHGIYTFNELLNCPERGGSCYCKPDSIFCNNGLQSTFAIKRLLVKTVFGKYGYYSGGTYVRAPYPDRPFNIDDNGNTILFPVDNARRLDYTKAKPDPLTPSHELYDEKMNFEFSDDYYLIFEVQDVRIRCSECGIGLYYKTASEDAQLCRSNPHCNNNNCDMQTTGLVLSTGNVGALKQNDESSPISSYLQYQSIADLRMLEKFFKVAENSYNATVKDPCTVEFEVVVHMIPKNVNNFFYPSTVLSFNFDYTVATTTNTPDTDDLYAIAVRPTPILYDCIDLVHENNTPNSSWELLGQSNCSWGRSLLNDRFKFSQKADCFTKDILGAMCIDNQNAPSIYNWSLNAYSSPDAIHYIRKRKHITATDKQRLTFTFTVADFEDGNIPKGFGDTGFLISQIKDLKVKNSYSETDQELLKNNNNELSVIPICPPDAPTSGCFIMNFKDLDFTNLLPEYLEGNLNQGTGLNPSICPGFCKVDYGDLNIYIDAKCLSSFDPNPPIMSGANRQNFCINIETPRSTDYLIPNYQIRPMLGTDRTVKYYELKLSSHLLVYGLYTINLIFGDGSCKKSYSIIYAPTETCPVNSLSATGLWQCQCFEPQSQGEGNPQPTVFGTNPCSNYVIVANSGGGPTNSGSNGNTSLPPCEEGGLLLGGSTPVILNNECFRLKGCLEFDLETRQANIGCKAEALAYTKTNLVGEGVVLDQEGPCCLYALTAKICGGEKWYKYTFDSEGMYFNEPNCDPDGGYKCSEQRQMRGFMSPSIGGNSISYTVKVSSNHGEDCSIPAMSCEWERTVIPPVIPKMEITYPVSCSAMEQFITINITGGVPPYRVTINGNLVEKGELLHTGIYTFPRPNQMNITISIKDGCCQKSDKDYLCPLPPCRLDDCK